MCRCSQKRSRRVEEGYARLSGFLIVVLSVQSRGNLRKIIPRGYRVIATSCRVSFAFVARRNRLRYVKRYVTRVCKIISPSLRYRLQSRLFNSSTVRLINLSFYNPHAFMRHCTFFSSKCILKDGSTYDSTRTRSEPALGAS